VRAETGSSACGSRQSQTAVLSVPARPHFVVQFFLVKAEERRHGDAVLRVED